MIEDYRFGTIIISGKTYEVDLIIYPDRIDSKWWRKQGHNLVIDDIKEVIDAQPEVIVIGTGEPGLMQVSPEALAHLKTLNIETIVLPTSKACQEYNRVAKDKKVIACLHLTC